jgi:hypothetical protein
VLVHDGVVYCTAARLRWYGCRPRPSVSRNGGRKARLHRASNPDLGFGCIGKQSGCCVSRMQ